MRLWEKLPRGVRRRLRAELAIKSVTFWVPAPALAAAGTAVAAAEFVRGDFPRQRPGAASAPPRRVPGNEFGLEVAGREKRGEAENGLIRRHGTRRTLPRTLKEITGQTGCRGEAGSRRWAVVVNGSELGGDTADTEWERTENQTNPSAGAGGWGRDLPGRLGSTLRPGAPGELRCRCLWPRPDEAAAAAWFCCSVGPACALEHGAAGAGEGGTGGAGEGGREV